MERKIALLGAGAIGSSVGADLTIHDHLKGRRSETRQRAVTYCCEFQ